MSKDGMVSVIDALKKGDKFLITSHVNPEGDAVGSQIAMKILLERSGKTAVIVDQDPVPKNLLFLPLSDSVLSEVPEEYHYDVVVLVDCPVKERAGKVSSILDRNTLTINIDHHVSNTGFGDVNWVDARSSSAGEMIFRLAVEMGMDVNTEMGICLYTAIVTDTGMFNYGNTSPETHRVAGDLISAGVIPQAVYEKVFENRAAEDVRILGKVLSTLRTEEGGGISHMSLTSEMCREEGLETVSTDEFINFARSVEGARVSVLFKEPGNPEGKTGVSFRSRGDIDVNAIASRFGGGGHAAASGCMYDGPLEEARRAVLDEVKKALRGDRGDVRQ